MNKACNTKKNLFSANLPNYNKRGTLTSKMSTDTTANRKISNINSVKINEVNKSSNTGKITANAGKITINAGKISTNGGKIAINGGKMSPKSCNMSTDNGKTSTNDEKVSPKKLSTEDGGRNSDVDVEISTIKIEELQNTQEDESQVRKC